MATDFSKTDRVIRILVFLDKKKGRPAKIKEIGQYLENLGVLVNVRALQRDMNFLTEALHPSLKISGSKRTGFEYHFDGSFLKTAFGTHFESNEMLAALAMKKLLPSFKGTGIEKDFTSLLEKVEDRLPSEVYKDFESKGAAIHGGLDISLFGNFDWEAKRTLIDKLLKTILEHRKIRLFYKQGDKVKEYVYRPLQIFVNKGLPYFYAKHDKKGHISTFRISRIQKVMALSETFEPNKEDYTEIKEKMKGGIGIFDDKDKKPQQVTLLFEKWLQNQVEDRHWHPSQKIKTLPDERVELSMKVNINEELISWIFYWQGAVNVLEPESLKNEMKKRAEQIVALYK